MIILKAIFKNLSFGIFNRKITLKINDNSNYSIVYSDALKNQQYVTLYEAIEQTNFFKEKRDGIYGTLTIEFNNKAKDLNIYSNKMINYYGVEYDASIGWIVIHNVSKEYYDLKYPNNKISIFNDSLEFVRYVEVDTVEEVLFNGNNFPIECVYEVKKDSENNCMVCELGFNYEWIATYKYSLLTGEFEELLYTRRL